MKILSTWRLKKGAETKAINGHPWIFASDLAEKPSEFVNGSLVELADYRGRFVAIGYGNLNSQIVFRALSASPAIPNNLQMIEDKMTRAVQLRVAAGLNDFSYRLIYAEGDFLPGLIIDRYIVSETTSSEKCQIFVIQSSTYGIDTLLPDILQALQNTVKKGLFQFSWEQTAVLEVSESASRLLEGLDKKPRQILKAGPLSNWDGIWIWIQSSYHLKESIPFFVDIMSGQKTGFFLDQRTNTRILSRYLCHTQLQKLKILDICCYAGQWGNQCANTLTSIKKDVELHFVDASERALKMASTTAQNWGATVHTHKMDIMNDLIKLPEQSYDVVICDPPAFIKKKKDIPAGRQAYVKVFRESLKKCKPGGFIVASSCSGLLSTDDFKAVLAESVTSSHRGVQWLEFGGHSADHPQRAEFPQGTYLKAAVGIVNPLF